MFWEKRQITTKLFRHRPCRCETQMGRSGSQSDTCSQNKHIPACLALRPTSHLRIDLRNWPTYSGHEEKVTQGRLGCQNQRFTACGLLGFQPHLPFVSLYYAFHYTFRRPYSDNESAAYRDLEKKNLCRCIHRCDGFASYAQALQLRARLAATSATAVEYGASRRLRR